MSLVLGKTMQEMYCTAVDVQGRDSHLNRALRHPTTASTLLPIEGSKVSTAGATITRCRGWAQGQCSAGTQRLLSLLSRDSNVTEQCTQCMRAWSRDTLIHYVGFAQHIIPLQFPYSLTRHSQSKAELLGHRGSSEHQLRGRHSGSFGIYTAL